MATDRGFYLLAEGVGGAGKSLLLPKIERYLTEEFGLRVRTVREPGGVAGAEQIREFIFRARTAEVLDASGQAALFNAARYLLMGEQTIPLMDNGWVVLSDRSAPSTIVYQAIEGADPEYLDKLCVFGMRGVIPIACLFLDVSAETAMKRKAVDNGGDPYDTLGLRFFQKVVAGYRELCQVGWGGWNWQRIDGEQLPEQIEDDMKKIVGDVVKKRSL